MKVKYLIIGSGLAGASAIRGIRQLDPHGTILMIGNEPYLPYHRPPLTKSLWTGKKSIDDIYVENESYYRMNNIQVDLHTKITEINPATKIARTDKNTEIGFSKLLLATGGTPRQLAVSGGNLPEICYYRYLDDYKIIREKSDPQKKAIIIGGGFIGSEIAASLALNKVKTTIIYPDKYLCQKVFPPELGNALVQLFIKNGVTVDSEDIAVAFTRKNTTTMVHTRKGLTFEADLIIAGIGIVPNIDLAKQAGLSVANGIIVNNFLQTSQSDIFAAGDVALFPYSALDRQLRVEHWDNALQQGIYAGRNMVSQTIPYTYMPYFFSDLFDFGYEAVGDVNSELEVLCDWKEEFKTGVIYYLSENHVRGVMLCNSWDKTDLARDLIRANAVKADLRGAI